MVVVVVVVRNANLIGVSPTVSLEELGQSLRDASQTVAEATQQLLVAFCEVNQGILRRSSRVSAADAQVWLGRGWDGAGMGLG